MPMDEMSRRFALEDVGHSAGVFDPEKLAWMNRHYMKAAAPARMPPSRALLPGARFSARHRRGDAPTRVAAADGVGSVDRLEEIPDRLAFLFDYDARARAAARGRSPSLHESGAREVIAALPDAITGPLLDREAFRAWRAREGEDGQKGKALFHPIRVRSPARGRTRAGSRGAGDGPGTR
jgi:glutamyl/glutaminyl-tRNA synthetase